MTRTLAAAFAFLLAALSTPAAAAEISTHVLDLARGVGGAGVPVVLLRRDEAGAWQEVARARTDAEGRVRAFAGTATAGVYKLHFDMTGYAAPAKPFFPEIDVVFRVASDAGHIHVPVVVSPYGYSTYRGT